MDLSRTERLLVLASVKGCICFTAKNHKVTEENTVVCSKCTSLILNKSECCLII